MAEMRMTKPWRYLGSRSGLLGWMGLAWLALTSLVTAAEPEVQQQTYTAKDTLDCPLEANSDARQMLDEIRWTPQEFTVTCVTEPYTSYDHLVRFPSPVDSGNPVLDLVALEWYIPPEAHETDKPLPAVVVIHESGGNMPVGRLFARGVQAKGFHAFMIQLPYYGKRKPERDQPSGTQFVATVRQAIADVRRARDAVAALPGIDTDNISVQGTSLGGFVASLASSLDDGYQRTFITLAGGNLYDIVTNGRKDAGKVRAMFEKDGYQGPGLKDMLNQIEPNRIAHRLDPQRTWMFTGELDEVIPLADAESLAQTAKLPPDHHIKVAAGHYTAIVYFPTILQLLGKEIGGGVQ